MRLVTRRERVNESEKGQERERDEGREVGARERERWTAARVCTALFANTKRPDDARVLRRLFVAADPAMAMAWQLPCGAALGPAADVILSLSTGKLILISGKRAAFQDSWDEKEESGERGREGGRDHFVSVCVPWVRHDQSRK